MSANILFLRVVKSRRTQRKTDKSVTAEFDQSLSRDASATLSAGQPINLVAIHCCVGNVTRTLFLVMLDQQKRRYSRMAMSIAVLVQVVNQMCFSGL